MSVASSPDGVTFSPLQVVANGQDMQTVPVPDGRYLKIVVDFTRSSTDGDNDGIKDSPILYDLSKTEPDGGDNGGNGDIEVGGDVYPVSWLTIWAPWVALAAVIVAGGITIAARRRRVQS